MSRLIVILFAIAALFATGSCVPSVHGIATESNIIYRPELVGSWVSDDNSAAWVFSSVDELHYMLELVTQEGTDGLFNVALVELEGELVEFVAATRTYRLTVDAGAPREVPEQLFS